MPKGLRKPMEEMPLEGGGGYGGGMGGGKGFSEFRLPRKRDTKEKLDYEPELSGKLDFPGRKSRSYDSSDRTPRTSDDYKKGGKTASSRADGCCQRGKTRGKMV